jgi:hypothetical protein
MGAALLFGQLIDKLHKLQNAPLYMHIASNGFYKIIFEKDQHNGQR